MPKLCGDPAKATLPEERVNSARRVGLRRRAIPADWVRQDARRAEYEGVPITGPIDGVRAVLCGHTILGYRQQRLFKHWPAIFNHDATLTSVGLDRLLHHPETVTLEGNSFRMKDVIDK